MAYGSVLIDTVQSSTAATAPVFKDGNGTQIGTLCRAWVNFNGTGTVAIRASFNVSSITDNGVGDYTVNFTNAMPDANYSIVGSGGGTSTNMFCVTPCDSTTPRTTTACRVNNAYANVNQNDTSVLNIAVFR